MLPVRGLLHDVVCPSFRDGECEKKRIGCVFSHDTSLLPVRPHQPEPEKRPVKKPRVGMTEPPRITSAHHSSTSKLTLAQRQDGLKKMYTSLRRFYAPLFDHSEPALQHLGADMATNDALRMEQDVFQHANEFSYKSSSIVGAASVTKRSSEVLAASVAEAAQALSINKNATDEAARILEACTETGTETDVRLKRESQQQRKKGRLTRERLVKAGFLCPKGDLEQLGYLMDVPSEWGPGGEAADASGEKQTCVRCGVVFKVGPLGAVQSAEACHFHPGRPRRERLGETTRSRKVFRWTCCGRTADSNALGEDRCATGPHVFKEETPQAMHRRAGYVRWSDIPSAAQEASEVLPVAALDCEMSYTTAGMSVTRVTLVDETGDVLFDEMIRCPEGVSMIDLNTQFSGIQAEAYEAEAVFDLDSARKTLAQYIGPHTILIGHGLENDLHALRLLHTNVVDTCQLFPHPRGLPFRLALRDLVSQHLGKLIQTGGASVGHSSAEDAQMTLDLVRWKWMNRYT